MFDSLQLDWKVLLAALSIIFGGAGVITYIIDIVRDGGSTKPNTVSFILWTLCQFIMIAAQIKDGPSLSLAILIIASVGTTITAILCLRGYGHPDIGQTEFWSAVLAIVAMMLWQIAVDPKWATVFAIAADLCASIPTFRKVHREPKSETFRGWLLFATGAFFAALATRVLDFENLAPAIYLVVNNVLVIFLIFFGQQALTRRSAKLNGPREI